MSYSPTPIRTSCPDPPAPDSRYSSPHAPQIPPPHQPKPPPHPPPPPTSPPPPPRIPPVHPHPPSNPFRPVRHSGEIPVRPVRTMPTPADTPLTWTARARLGRTERTSCAPISTRLEVVPMAVPAPRSDHWTAADLDHIPEDGLRYE